MQCAIYKNEIELRIEQIRGLVNQKFKTNSDVCKFSKLSSELLSLLPVYKYSLELLLKPGDCNMPAYPAAESFLAEIQGLKDQFKASTTKLHLIEKSSSQPNLNPGVGKGLGGVYESAGLTLDMKRDLDKLDSIFQLTQQAHSSCTSTAGALHQQNERLQGFGSGLNAIGQNLTDTNKVLNRMSSWVNQFRTTS